MNPLLIGDLGTPELIIILVVVMLVFGGQKLPDLARGSGRAIRIFKAEVSDLDAEEPDAETVAVDKSAVVRQAPAEPATGARSDSMEARQAAEREALEARHAAERRDLGSQA